MQDEEGYAVLRLQSKKKEFSQLPPDSHRPPQWQGTPLKVAFTVIVILQVVMLVLICLVLIQMELMKSQAADSGNASEKFNHLGKSLRVAFGQQVCPEGWKLHRQKCYFFYNLTIKRTWNESKTICSEKKSHLAVIRDTCDMGFLWSQIPPSSYYWIGLHIPSPGGNWIWLDGSALNWSQFRVEDSAKKGSCALLSRDGIYPDNCAAVNLWICQHDMAP